MALLFISSILDAYKLSLPAIMAILGRECIIRIPKAASF